MQIEFGKPSAMYSESGLELKVTVDDALWDWVSLGDADGVLVCVEVRVWACEPDEDCDWLLVSDCVLEVVTLVDCVPLGETSCVCEDVAVPVCVRLAVNDAVPDKLEEAI